MTKLLRYLVLMPVVLDFITKLFRIISINDRIWLEVDLPLYASTY